ncbi:MAG: carbon-nitrogen hydrolase family protein [Desulfatitalea sp.]|nr:carbon-nitrogen hydrolase family protein [Desulfatitalea sp.]NNK01747.1 carbon-nitrogen hydrolase family protein [Desulfatitalea sp.]
MQILSSVLIGCWVFFFGLFPGISTIPGAFAAEAGHMKLALIHFAAAHKQPEENRAALLTLNRQAAEAGAALILNTEMAVSGYSFRSRKDIAPYTETDDGPTIRAMGALAAAHGVYIGITFPERDPATGIFYNSAFLLEPEGRIVARYRKMLTERRWARPGEPRQPGVADTPWGRLGMVICADSYSGLIARGMALKAVDLLWIPANWPSMGGLDPLPLWRARALENGYYLAACNRTGKDLTLDCTQAVSCVFDPAGHQMLSGRSENSRAYFVDLPLDHNGKWAQVSRSEKMGQRNVGHYRPIYLRPWLENFTSFYKLPEPGMMSIHCYVPAKPAAALDELAVRIAGQADAHPALWVIPQMDAAQVDTAALAALAKKHRVGLAVTVRRAGAAPGQWLFTPDETLAFSDAKASASPSDAFPFSIHHFGPAAIAMVPANAFAHPETAIALSKLGCDLVILSEAALTEENFLLARVKALSGIAVAACATNGAQITGVQDMHLNWDKIGREGSGAVTYTLDTTKTRKKMFFDFIDYDLLLSNENESAGITPFLSGGF